MDASTVILNLAYVSLLAATATRTVVRLRVALVTAAIGFVLFGILTDNVTMIIWNVATGSLHLLQLWRWWEARRSITLSAEAESIRERLFPTLDRFDFFTMWSMGEDVTLTDSALTIEGEMHEAISLVLDGRFIVRRQGRDEVSLGPDNFIGEISYATGEPASATVMSDGTARVRMWEHARVTALSDLNPSAGRALTTLMNRDLANKLTT